MLNTYKVFLKFICFSIFFGGSSDIFAECDPQFRQVNTDGFGSVHNLYAWNMIVYRGALFTSTYNPMEGGEIWRFNGLDWLRVAHNGLGDISNEGFRTLIEFNGYLYAGSFNTLDGAQLWRSPNGFQWQQVVSGGFGSADNVSVRGMVVFNGALYVGLQNDGEEGAQIWRSIDGADWTQVANGGLGNINNDSVHDFAVFRGRLYAAMRNDIEGFSLARSGDGETFEFVIGGDSAYPHGLNSPDTATPYHIHVSAGRAAQRRLYIAAGNWPTGAAVFKSFNGTYFQAVTTDGFGNPNNKFAWRFHNFRGDLWLGLSNSDIVNDGANVWRTEDRVNWTQMVGNEGSHATAGFGNQTNWGVRSFASFNRRLYLGTAQCWADNCIPFNTGTQVWEWRGEICREN